MMGWFGVAGWRKGFEMLGFEDANVRQVRKGQLEQQCLLKCVSMTEVGRAHL